MGDLDPSTSATYEHLNYTLQRILHLVETVQPSTCATYEHLNYTLQRILHLVDTVQPPSPVPSFIPSALGTWTVAIILSIMALYSFRACLARIASEIGTSVTLISILAPIYLHIHLAPFRKRLAHIASEIGTTVTIISILAPIYLHIHLAPFRKRLARIALEIWTSVAIMSILTVICFRTRLARLAVYFFPQRPAHVSTSTSHHHAILPAPPRSLRAGTSSHEVCSLPLPGYSLKLTRFQNPRAITEETKAVPPTWADR